MDKEIRVFPFKFKHLDMLKEMFIDQKDYDLDYINMQMLPKIGYIAMIQHVPIAAGFLRRIEGNVTAEIDVLVSNPYLGSIIRNEGLNKVGDELIREAKELGVKTIIAVSVDNSVIKRAEDRGFHTTEHRYMVLNLQGD